jgi:hypothetical protein
MKTAYFVMKMAWFVMKMAWFVMKKAAGRLCPTAFLMTDHGRFT